MGTKHLKNLRRTDEKGIHSKKENELNEKIGRGTAIKERDGEGRLKGKAKIGNLSLGSVGLRMN